MSMDRVSGPPASNVALAQTTARPTPTPERAGASFGAVLAAGGNAIAKGASAAVSVLPGGSQLAAAVRGAPTPQSLATGAAAGPLGGGIGGAGLSPQGPTLGAGGITVGGVGATGIGAGTVGDPVADMQAQQMQLIELQTAIQSSSQQFSTMSNVLNAEHQAAMGAIQNIRA
jgi:hypothetical protein